MSAVRKSQGTDPAAAWNVLSEEALQRCFDWTVGCGCHCWCAQSCLHNMRLSSGVADCLRVHLARRRGRARLWLSPVCAFVYSLVSLSRCRRVDTCTLLDSFLEGRSFRPVDSEISRDASSVHDVGLVYLRSHPAVLTPLARVVSPGADTPRSSSSSLSVQARRGHLLKTGATRKLDGPLSARLPW